MQSFHHTDKETESQKGMVSSLRRQTKMRAKDQTPRYWNLSKSPQLVLSLQPASLSTQQVPSHSFQPPLSKLVPGEEAGTSLQQGGDVSSSSPRGRVASYTADKK